MSRNHEQGRSGPCLEMLTTTILSIKSKSTKSRDRTCWDAYSLRVLLLVLPPGAVPIVDSNTRYHDPDDDHGTDASYQGRVHSVDARLGHGYEGCWHICSVWRLIQRNGRDPPDGDARGCELGFRVSG